MHDERRAAQQDSLYSFLKRNQFYGSELEKSKICPSFGKLRINITRKLQCFS